MSNPKGFWQRLHASYYEDFWHAGEPTEPSKHHPSTYSIKYGSESTWKLKLQLWSNFHHGECKAFIREWSRCLGWNRSREGHMASRATNTWLAGQPTRGRPARNVHAINLLESVSPPRGSRKHSRQESLGTTTIKGHPSMGLGRPAAPWARSTSVVGHIICSCCRAHDFCHLWIIENIHGFYPMKMLFHHPMSLK
jgi:hypothetical protein